MEIKFFADAASGNIDSTMTGVAFLLACMFTLILAIIVGEEECDCCGHTNYQHDDKGCAGKDAMGNWGAVECRCKKFRKAVRRG